MPNRLKKIVASEAPPRPDVYRYHDHRGFLTDLVAQLKVTRPGFSLRSLASDSNLAVGYLSMVLSGTRSLSSDALEKMVRPLGLTAAERTHLELLRILGESDSQEVRASALERIQKFSAYQRVNPQESEAFQYLTRWINVAIREMVSLHDFCAEPAWISDRLRKRLPLKQVEDAFNFLVENKYLELLPKKKARLPKKDLQCIGGVFRLVLSQFHRQMLALASESFDNTPHEDRNITGQTIAIAQEDWPELRKILDTTLEKLGELEKNPKPKDTVYHITFAAFPLTKTQKE